MWQRLRDFRISWKWGVLVGVVLIVLGKFLELSGNEVTMRSGHATVEYGILVLVIGVIAGINARVRAANRRKTAELPR